MTQLSIPAPCSEKWSDMTPVRHDCRFCAACERQILDFTGKTDAEILEHLKKNNGKICGRFRQEQLNRPIRATTQNRGTNTRRGGLTAAAASVAALLAAQQPAENQSVAPAQLEQAPVDSHFKISKVAPKQDSLRTISGKVLDAESGEGLIGVSVVVMGTERGAVTDIDGVFSLKLPLEMIQDQPIRLGVHYTGFHSVEVEIPKRIKQENLSLLPIKMEFNPAALSGLVGIVVITKPTFGQRIRNFFHRLFD